jgi:hypothetical protein
MSKKRYKIPCVWQVYGFAYIEADSLDEAAEIAESDMTPLPENSSYVDGSFEVDHEALECYNEED